MSMRSYVEEHPLVAIVAMVVMLGLAGVSIWYTTFDASRTSAAMLRGWFSDDDGHSWFAGDQRMLPPFDHDGKQACRAYVFTCDGGKTKFVAYLERYTPSAKSSLEKAREEAKKGPPIAGLYERLEATGVEVKKPGDADWVNVKDPKAASIRKVACPSGAAAEPVLP